jgi:uncharacterized membrane protein
MDRHQLVTIAVTAAITLTVTAALKWLAALAKTVSTSSSTKTAVKKIFRKNTRDVTLALLALGYFGWLLIRIMRGTSPITRLDVLNIVLLTLGVIFEVGMIAFNIITAHFDRVRQRTYEAERKRVESLMPK